MQIHHTSGLILAGGQGQRMGQQEKAWLLFRGQPLIHHALNAIKPVVSTVWISANQSQQRYQALGVKAISDPTMYRFYGPLAGILAGLHHCQTEYLLIMPCDMPLIQSHHLALIINELQNSHAEIAIAHDGVQLQPLLLAIKTQVKMGLTTFLAAGERKVSLWLTRHCCIIVDFSQQARIFTNLNTPAQLQALEQSLKSC